MTDLTRTFTVDSVEPGSDFAPRTHAVLTSRGGEGVDVLHLWTDDAELVDALVPGAQLDLRLAPDDHCWTVAEGVGEFRGWLVGLPSIGDAIAWTRSERRATRFSDHEAALAEARLCAAAGHTVAVLPRDGAVPRG